MSKEIRTFWAASAFIVLVLCLGAVLIYIDIPAANKDLVVSIVSVLVGATGVAVAKVLGEEEGELGRVKAELEKMRLEHSLLKANYDSLIRLLVDRHIIAAEGITVKEPQ